MNSNITELLQLFCYLAGILVIVLSIFWMFIKPRIEIAEINETLIRIEALLDNINKGQDDTLDESERLKK